LPVLCRISSVAIVAATTPETAFLIKLRFN